MIKIDKDLLKSMRVAGRCEGCGVYCNRRVPHHLLCRGMSGGSRLDVPLNLISLGGPWDCRCHDKAQGDRQANARLICIVALREGVTPEALIQTLHDLLREKK